MSCLGLCSVNEYECLTQQPCIWQRAAVPCRPWSNYYYSFEEGKSDKEILDNLLQNTRYDKRLLPPVRGHFPFIKT
ncbi:hypothetical protein NQ315_008707 [Exocentrus adspersus]|uniref:Uncharacterized protein n=1 Tax=Exocentrus adspersus TaxID=1586481 RepID=A0AAV8W616_9CUCU|nr:hypothetical protein NQ315_008707 [Exocentrus adspersus]